MADKKKLLFVINNLQTGGVQTSLINLINEIHDKYEITVLSFAFKKEYCDIFPENINIIGLKSPYKYLGFSQGELKNHQWFYINRAAWAMLIRVVGRSRVIPLMNIFQRKIGSFDCAISYLHECPQKNTYGGCNEFVLKRVKAKKKITWLHCDFELCGANNAFSKSIYSKFDTIVACSEGTRASFVKCLPELADKCKSLRNCNNYEKIKELSKCAFMYDEEYLNIVTVARLAEEKGIERAIYAVNQCINKGYKVKYHIIGSGDQEKVLKNLVKENGLSDDTVIFYGNQTNPYRYIVNADLFLLPSYHEAAPMVFDEAACLGVPVIATQTTSTDEMIIKSGNGIVCENSLEGITKAMEKVLSNPRLLNEIKHTLQNKEFNNAEIIANFDKIIF
ncbi:MAG: glycosyltransferase [Clostridia bacterium]|nr:glycosyltransferase [Clostridia bacterium]